MNVIFIKEISVREIFVVVEEEGDIGEEGMLYLVFFGGGGVE